MAQTLSYDPSARLPTFNLPPMLKPPVTWASALPAQHAHEPAASVFSKISSQASEDKA